MAEPGIGVFIVDDHRIVRDGVALIIEREPDLTVVGSAASGEEAIATFGAARPDVVLMDLQLPAMSGVDAIRAIRHLDMTTPIVVLTVCEGDEDIYQSLEAGATAYLFKDALSDDLVRVIREVHAGERPIPSHLKAQIEDRAGRPKLTKREIEVLELVLDGQRGKEIAFSLSISEDTVQVHLKNVFAKLNVHNRTAALAVALRRGIIHARREK